MQHEIVRFPESVQPYLDYQIIGSEFYADHGGAFCRGGYAVRKDELPERFLQTEQEKNQRSVMLLRLRASHGGQQAPADTTLTLPASDDELDRTKQRLGIDEFAEAEIVTVDYVFPYFSTMVPQDEATVEDANELAHYIEQMSHKDGELLKYLSALQIEQPYTFQLAIRTAVDIDDYEQVPADADQYGRMVFQRTGVDDEVVNLIDGYMDFESLGKDWMREDGVVQTEFGMIRRLHEPFETQGIGEMKME